MYARRFVGSPFTAALVLFAALGLSACGGDGNGGNNNAKTVVGTALSVLNGDQAAPQANRAFSVNDLSGDDAPQKIAEGTTDANGEFSFEVSATQIIFIVFDAVDELGEPRTSGLVFVDDDTDPKTLRDFTDIACQAGVTAVTSGDLAAEDLTAERIENLELGAQAVIANGGVDFNDATGASVAAAAAEVRQLTDDGAHPPPEA